LQLVHGALQLGEHRDLVDGGLVEEATQSQQLVAAEGGERVLAAHARVDKQVVHGQPRLRLAPVHLARLGLAHEVPLALHEAAQLAAVLALPRPRLDQRRQHHQHVVRLEQPRRHLIRIRVRASGQGQG
jgi:hypothetical protein